MTPTELQIRARMAAVAELRDEIRGRDEQLQEELQAIRQLLDDNNTNNGGN